MATLSWVIILFGAVMSVLMHAWFHIRRRWKRTKNGEIFKGELTNIVEDSYIKKVPQNLWQRKGQELQYTQKN